MGLLPLAPPGLGRTFRIRDRETPNTRQKPCPCPSDLTVHQRGDSRGAFSGSSGFCRHPKAKRAPGAFSLLPLHHRFFSSCRVQVWSPTGWWQQVNYQSKRALYPMSLRGKQLGVRLGGGYWGHCAAGLRKGGPKPAAGTPSSVQGSPWPGDAGKGRVLCFPEEDSGPSSAPQVPQPCIWGPGLPSPCPNPALRAPSASLRRAGHR